LKWLSLNKSKFYNWQQREGRENQHNNKIPRKHWLLAWEIAAIINFRRLHLDEGYRRLTYMMLDQNIVAVSPTSVYRVLKREGLLFTQWRHQKAKGNGFTQPLGPHQHWHLDISYINFQRTFVYLVALIDGYSRYVVHHELRLSVESLDVEILMERALLKFSGQKPILITDNGPQFKAKEFKEYLQLVGITHRKTRFYYPQSNGKVERFFQSYKNESHFKHSYFNLDELRNKLNEYIFIYNTRRLHSSLGYITPQDMLNGNQQTIFSERRYKLSVALQNRIKANLTHGNVFPLAKNITRSEDQNQGRAQRDEVCLDFDRSGAYIEKPRELRVSDQQT
jgi:putative transposase